VKWKRAVPEASGEAIAEEPDAFRGRPHGVGSFARW
jgi:hypothetical protein